MRLKIAYALSLFAAASGGVAHAQQAAAPVSEPPALVDPFDIDPTTITVPDLAFTPTPNDIENYEKYFYFHRADTDFRTAMADIMTCDKFATGLDSGFRGVDTSPALYNPAISPIAGAAGGLLGNLIASAIVGSAEVRKMRRENMRTCMFYLGYDRYGLAKSIWEQFNFEEGLSRENPVDRLRALRQQARVASAITPVGEPIAP